MKIRFIRSSFGILVLIVIAMGIPTATIGADFALISKTDLKGMMEKDGPVIVDVRSPAAWESSNKKIAGAIRENPGEVSAWIQNYPKEAKLVFYCS